MNPEDIPLTCRYFQEGWGLDNMDQIFHIIPINELTEHVPTVKCNCQPDMEVVKIEEVDRYIVIHKSFLIEQIRKAQQN